MKLIKPDWTVLREAETSGLVAAMSSIIEHDRTDLNKELSNYFRQEVPDYNGTFGEDKCEDILFAVNSYMEEKGIDRRPIEFPITEGSEVYLIPITDNLKLKVLVADEYYGSGNYEKYVDASFFVINENTAREDVDVLIAFVKEHLQTS